MNVAPASAIIGRKKQDEGRMQLELAMEQLPRGDVHPQGSKECTQYECENTKLLAQVTEARLAWQEIHKLVVEEKNISTFLTSSSSASYELKNALETGLAHINAWAIQERRKISSAASLNEGKDAAIAALSEDVRQLDLQDTIPNKFFKSYLFLRNTHGKNLCVKQDGTLYHQAPLILSATGFSQQQWRLEETSHDNGTFYISNTDFDYRLCCLAAASKIVATRNRGKCEEWTMCETKQQPEKDNKTVVFRSHTGMNLSQDYYGGVWPSPKTTAWEQFSLVFAPAGSWLVVRKEEAMARLAEARHMADVAAATQLGEALARVDAECNRNMTTKRDLAGVIENLRLILDQEAKDLIKLNAELGALGVKVTIPDPVAVPVEQKTGHSHSKRQLLELEINLLIVSRRELISKIERYLLELSSSSSSCSPPSPAQPSPV